jgi:hypothetical protein
LNTSRDKLSAIAPTVDEHAGLATLRNGIRRTIRRRRAAQGTIAAVCVVALAGAFAGVKNSRPADKVTTRNTENTAAKALSTTFDAAAPTTTTAFVPDPNVRCPAPPFNSPRWDEATNDAYGVSQGELRPDAQSAVRYLASVDHGLDLEYALVMPARLTIRVSGQVEETRAALSRLLTYPDRADIVLIPYSKGRRKAGVGGTGR